MKRRVIKNSCLIVAIIVVLAFLINQMRWKTQLFDCPAPSLDWGMERSEVVERLGLSAKEAAGGPADSIWLDPEQLGWDPAEAWGIPALPDETGRGRIRLSFLNEENSGNGSGYGRLFLISFSISIQSRDQLMKIMRPLYNVPEYWSSREDYVMGYWFCFPDGTSAPSGELQHCGYSNSIDRTELYPQLYIESEQRDEGEEYRGSVWFMAGPINFPAGGMQRADRLVMMREYESNADW